MKLIDYNATLTERVDITESLAIFRLKPDEPVEGASKGWFRPGQYVTIGLNNIKESEKGAVLRPMSIASSAFDPEIELYIRYVNDPASDNPLTHLLWNLRVGDRAYVRAVAKGKFTIEDTLSAEDDRRRVYVSAGTGLAPFLSICRTQSQRRGLSNTVVIHGVSYEADLGYREELTALERLHGLTYLPTLSRAGTDWGGARGRAEDFFLPDRLDAFERLAGFEAGCFSPENAVVYICGLTGTVGQCIERLIPRGFVPDHRAIKERIFGSKEKPASLFFEQYDSEPLLDLEDQALIDRLASEARSS